MELRREGNRGATDKCYFVLALGRLNRFRDRERERGGGALSEVCLSRKCRNKNGMRFLRTQKNKIRLHNNIHYDCMRLESPLDSSIFRNNADPPGTALPPPPGPPSHSLCARAGMCVSDVSCVCHVLGVRVCCMCACVDGACLPLCVCVCVCVCV